MIPPLIEISNWTRLAGNYPSRHRPEGGRGSTMCRSHGVGLPVSVSCWKAGSARLAGCLGCTLACSASTTSGPSTGRRMMTQRLAPRSDRPLSLQLADVLRAEIQEGTRGPGSQLPTESELQHEYGVSRTTIRAALSTLAAEGLVVTRKGFGSYVRDRQPLRRGSPPAHPPS